MLRQVKRPVERCHLLAKVTILKRIHLRPHATATGNTGQRGLGLGRLALLPALVGRLLLLHLLVAKCGKGAGNLLDLVARQILGQLLGEFLQEQGVVRLLGAAGEDGAEDVAQLFKLQFRGRLEQRQGRDINRLGWIARVDGNGAAGGRRLAPAADPDVSEQVFGVPQVGLLLGAAQALAALRLGLVVIAVFLVGVGAGLRALRLALGYPLGLALLVGGGFGLGLGLRFGGLLGLLALNLGIFGGIPRF